MREVRVGRGDEGRGKEERERKLVRRERREEMREVSGERREGR